MRLVFLLFIIMPIVEMVLLIQVGSVIGAWYTVGLVLLTAVIGVNLLKRQGLSTLLRAQQKAQQGALPVSEIGEGLLLAVAGALLLTPGFVTDAIGFALLTPGLRSQLAKLVAARMIVSGTQFSHSTYSSQSRSDRFDDAIDAEYEEVHERRDQLK
ncbi:hypothetical protein A3715_07410 [Oleiphilus sp. HI0009]|nr:MULTISPECIES: FxsA family protein [unclassified Oleiphilus]KZX81351.1 hypothetical protein A3715_07410 [Oleiphilus sp. HI0009]KZY63280.1 hypothetical protein A3738_12160 [Oleiphilus sp. HI0066]KZY70807.1 hypothetical protein A3739_06035 [Oleiphilus sp. HI0067]MCH2159673.1 FxsA family protein [Oleiphilaceae bacterium]